MESEGRMKSYCPTCKATVDFEDDGMMGFLIVCKVCGVWFDQSSKHMDSIELTIKEIVND